jgi:hypothetical protein
MLVDTWRWQVLVDVGALQNFARSLWSHPFSYVSTNILGFLISGLLFCRKKKRYQ